MFFDKKDNIKMQQSPIKEKQIEELIDTKRDVLNHLQHLFTYYASKFSRHNYHKLPHKSYMEMMEKLFSKHQGTFMTKSSEERRIELEKIRSVQVLYFSKGCKEGATFNQFLQMIPGLARIVYPQLRNQVQASEMITKDLLNLYRRQVQIKLSALQEQTTRYIMKLAPQFLKIYKTYFSHEINRNRKKQDFRDQSMKCFVSFMKQFQVFPKLITAGGICFIYKSVLDNPQTQILDEELKDSLPFQDYKNSTGMLFTLGKLISALVAISKVANQKIKSNEQQQELEKDGFRSLLQYIEMTKAYKKQRHLKDTGKSFSFILLEQYPKQFLKQQPKIGKDGKQIIAKKENQFVKMLKKMEI